ncbi:hypothetical protein evm_002211 [Chilo suppressalis]|nr:hypothetical protein evm_002211 [Chilo suppressalis]
MCYFIVGFLVTLKIIAFSEAAEQNRSSTRDEVTKMNVSVVNVSKSINISNDTILSVDSESNDTVPWNKFLAILIGVTLERLDNIEYNIKTFYNLEESEIALIDKAFNITDYEYEYLLHHHLKMIMKEKMFNNSEEFMLDFMDLSNEIMTKIVKYNLLHITGNLTKLEKGYKQTQKDKILRHQVKSSVALVELIMCTLVSVCRERDRYSEYAIEWLRFLLNERDNKLFEFFNNLPTSLDKYDKSIKSTSQFHKNLKFVVKAGKSAQRDTLDLVDEILTNPDHLRNTPDGLKKTAILTKKLFNEIDSAYVMTDEDIEELESITQMLAIWSRNGPVTIAEILDAIMDNMISNQEIWQKDHSNKVKKIWFDIINLNNM